MVTLLHPPVDSSLKITDRSSGMPHLTCKTSCFLGLLFVFLISSILHRHPALFHHHALILYCLLTFLVAFSTLVLKLFFSRSFPHNPLFLP